MRSDCDKEYWICHKDGESGNYTVLCIDAEGYFGDPDDPDDQGHSGHVDDHVLDADGDGLTAENPCGIGSQDDCDDTDDTIYPGTEEVCGNGIDDNCNGKIDEGCCTFPLFTVETFEGANFSFHYDAAVNDCLGFLSADYADYVYVVSATFVAGTFDYEGVPFVIFLSDEGNCVLDVGEDITQAEYDAAKALLRSVIASNLIDNACDQ